MCYIVTIEN